MVTDRDSPLQSLLGSFVHWIVYDIPPETRRLGEDFDKLPRANGVREGINGFDKAGYGGPCPPGGAIHRYAFTVYALDLKPDLVPGMNLKTLDSAIEGHIVAQGTLVGHYH